VCKEVKKSGIGLRCLCICGNGLSWLFMVVYLFISWVEGLAGLGVQEVGQRVAF